MAQNNRAENGVFSYSRTGSMGRHGLPKIQTQHEKTASEVFHDDSTTPVKAKTIDELHSLQKKKSQPTTPITGSQGAFAATMSEEDRHKQQLQSISASLASLTRETGPKVVKGDPARKSDGQKATHVEHHLYDASLFGVMIVPSSLLISFTISLLLVFVNDQFLNWDPEHRIKVRIVSARAYHSLFMHNMCIRPTPEELEDFVTPDFTIYNAGQFPCNRYTHYMTSSTSVDLNLSRREMVILGTQYAGEMKKGLFSVMHYLMPKLQILSLHSGCNMGKDGDVALFFGLSGTGKTTLSTDHNRYLIGDDEHCWSNNGVSNIEGGCYAKCIDLSKDKEPDIWNAIKFGTGT